MGDNTEKIVLVKKVFQVIDILSGGRPPPPPLIGDMYEEGGGRIGISASFQ